MKGVLLAGPCLLVALVAACEVGTLGTPDGGALGQDAAGSGHDATTTGDGAATDVASNADQSAPDAGTTADGGAVDVITGGADATVDATPTGADGAPEATTTGGDAASEDAPDAEPDAESDAESDAELDDAGSVTRVVGSEPPLATAVGTTTGNAVTATIGPAGGTIASADGRYTLTFPAGALTAAQTIGIQPITNTAPHGLGSAYRLTPDGLTFAAPVTETLTYTAADVANSSPDQIGIAYQLADGTWATDVGGTLDTTAQSVSIPITHFTDRAAFVSCSMQGPSPPTILTGTTAAAALTCVSSITPLEGHTAIPLYTPGNPITQALARPWQVVWNAGAFTVTYPDPSSPSPVILVAPSSVPTPDPVTVSATLTTYDLLGSVLGAINQQTSVFVLGRHWSLDVSYDTLVDYTPLCAPTCPGGGAYLADYEMDGHVYLTFTVVQSGSGFTINADPGQLPSTGAVSVSPPPDGSAFSCCPADFSVTMNTSPGNDEFDTFTGSVDPDSSLMTLEATGSGVTAPGYSYTDTKNGQTGSYPTATGQVNGGLPAFLPTATYDYSYQTPTTYETYKTDYYVTSLDPN